MDTASEKQEMKSPFDDAPDPSSATPGQPGDVLCRELLGVYETLVRRYTFHTPECVASTSLDKCDCGFVAQIERLAKVQRRIARVK